MLRNSTDSPDENREINTYDQLLQNFMNTLNSSRYDREAFAKLRSKPNGLLLLLVLHSRESEDNFALLLNQLPLLNEITNAIPVMELAALIQKLNSGNALSFFAFFAPHDPQSRRELFAFFKADFCPAEMNHLFALDATTITALINARNALVTNTLMQQKIMTSLQMIMYIATFIVDAGLSKDQVLQFTNNTELFAQALMSFISTLLRKSAETDISLSLSKSTDSSPYTGTSSPTIFPSLEQADLRRTISYQRHLNQLSHSGNILRRISAST